MIKTKKVVTMDEFKVAMSDSIVKNGYDIPHAKLPRLTNTVIANLRKVGIEVV